MKMKWSWKIGRLAGIDVYVHATFLFLPLLVVFAHLSGGGGTASLLGGLLLMLCAFGIIVLHELGHALAARHYGIGTRDIILLPIGGVARLERIPEDPTRELVIALAGPAVNVMLAGLLLVPALLAMGWSTDAVTAEYGAGFLATLVLLNIALALFNMIPAFPMDGGRVLRALLAYAMPHVSATRIAVRIGRSLAIVFGLAGMLFQPMLVLVAAFVWFGAGQELLQVEMRHALRRMPALFDPSLPIRRVAPAAFDWPPTPIPGDAHGIEPRSAIRIRIWPPERR